MASALTVDGAVRDSDLGEVMKYLSTWSSRRTPGPILGGISILGSRS